MSENLQKVKNYIVEIDMQIVSENEENEIIVVDDEDSGIRNLVLDCEPPIVVMEQMIMAVPDHPGDLFKRLLQINRTLVHGAFVLDESGKHIFFRDTLQLESLDLNELEASIGALSLAMAENADELLSYAKKNVQQ